MVMFFASPVNQPDNFTLKSWAPQSAEAILETSSCPISLTQPGFVFLGVAWELPSQMRIHLNDTIVADTDSIVPDSYEVPKRKPLKPEDREDFSRDSATKRIQRRGTITGYQHNPRRIPGDRQYLIEQLAAEAAQVQEFLQLLDGGRLEFARSLANSLGLLMADGTPMPLIQMAAAELDMPLIVYTSARPNIQIPSSPNVTITFDISAQPNDICQNPIDLDVWLGLRGASLDGRDFTHRQTIAAIRNTTGSHADLDIDPLVAQLRSMSSAVTGGQEYDFLVEYVRNLAVVAVQLAQPILARSRLATDRI
jgi:hypothetical protein